MPGETQHAKQDKVLVNLAARDLYYAVGLTRQNKEDPGTLV